MMIPAGSPDPVASRRSGRPPVITPKLPKMGKTKIVTGDELLSVLSSQKTQVKWIWRDGSCRGRIDAREAIDIVTLCGGYEGKAKPGRVYYIRETEKSKPINQVVEISFEFWKDRAVIKFHSDQRASEPLYLREKKRVDLWDKMLHSDPLPASWRRRSNNVNPIVSDGALEGQASPE